MADSTSSLRNFTPDQTNRLNGLKTRRRSISISLHETTTPAIKSISSLEHIDISDNNSLLISPLNSDLLSAYDKLTIWKRTIEKHLNRIYLHKLKEIDDLLSDGQTQIDITFGNIPAFEQLAVVTSQQEILDHTYDKIEFNHQLSQLFDLTSNNILLGTSNHNVVIYDDIKSKLMLYNEKSYLNSFYWDTNEYGDPCDLTYSNYLDLYCIITNRGLFTWSSENLSLPLHIDSIKPIVGNRLWTIASTDSRADVFILFKLGSYIERWNSIVGTKSWQPIQRWSNHDLFERNDQRIRSIRMTANYVAWTVESTKTSEWRVDLLDYHLRIIRQGIQISHLDKNSSCLLSNCGPDHFLITDSNCHLLFLLDSYGRMKLKTDSIIHKRIKNSVLMNNNNQQWLVVRLERPDQLYFIALTDQTEVLDGLI
ncbi:hypothetical protein I4U23_008421 [Adineta vaga]|nr:hypothetical protein I4U23_008421 [Adineta vaga]